MTWLLKIEFLTKQSMEMFLEHIENDIEKEYWKERIIDMELEEIKSHKYMGVRKKLMQPHHANYFQSRIKTRVQYYCADCGSFVSKETMNCKTCTEKNDPYLSSNS